MPTKNMKNPSLKSLSSLLTNRKFLLPLLLLGPVGLILGFLFWFNPSLETTLFALLFLPISFSTIIIIGISLLGIFSPKKERNLTGSRFFNLLLIFVMHITIMAMVSVFVAEQMVSTKRKCDSISAENSYNQVVLNTITKNINGENPEEKILLNRFSTQGYLRDWDIILREIHPDCIEDLSRMIGEMETINLISASILNPHNQKGFMLEDKWQKNMKDFQQYWRESLSFHTLELKTLFDKIWLSGECETRKICNINTREKN